MHMSRSKIKKGLVRPGLIVGLDVRPSSSPLENKRNFLEVSGEIVERVDPIFYSDPMTAAMKSLA
jgi:ATP-dependent Lon protease